jgi:hypothetical protein
MGTPDRSHSMATLRLGHDVDRQEKRLLMQYSVEWTLGSRKCDIVRSKVVSACTSTIGGWVEAESRAIDMHIQGLAWLAPTPAERGYCDSRGNTRERESSSRSSTGIT